MASLSYYGVGNQSNWNTPIEPEKPTPTQAPLIPPELQSIIDKVSGSSMSVGRKGELMTHLGGVVGGLEQNRRSQEGEMQRFGVSSQLGKQKLGLEEKGIGLQEKGLGIEQQKVDLEKRGTTGWLQKAIMKKFGVTGKTPAGTTGTSGNWWENHPNINFINY